MLNGVIDEHSKIYGNLVFIGDFNVGNTKTIVTKFL